MPLPTFAFGLLLRMAPTGEGGRQGRLAGGSGKSARFRYRPNWGLPGMQPPDQTGAPVLAFSREQIAPGECVRVVIVPPFPEMMPLWARVEPGTDLPMYEGSRVCGTGRVAWRQETQLPLSPQNEARFLEWVEGLHDASAFM